MSNFHSFGDFRHGGDGPAPKPGTVTVIENDDHYVSAVNACSKTGQLTVVDMNATWCGPCKMMKPLFHKMSEEFNDVFFLDVDVDKCRESASKAGVGSIPAFLLFKGDQQVDQLVGANPGKLRQLIEQHRTPAKPTAAMTGGRRLGEAEPAIIPDAGMLSSLIEMGFTEAHAKRALIAVKNSDLTQAIDWLSTNPDTDSMTDAPPPYQAQPPAYQEPTQFHAQPQQQSQQLSPEMMAAFLSAAASQAGISPQQAQAAAAPAPAQAQPAAPPVVHDALCNYCQQQIVGVRYKCTVCPDFDMCESCKNKGIHDASHKLTEITQNIRPKMTKAEVDLKVQELKQKAEEQRKKDEEAEKQRKKMQEIERRRAGKDLQQAKERFEQSQARRADIARKKEAQEAQAAKERIRKLIEQDKIERHARLAGEDPEAAAAAAASAQRPREHIVVPMKPMLTIPIQIRLPDGTYLKHEFDKNTTIRQLYDWARTNRTDPVPPEVTSFTLMMVAPRRVFSQMSLTLEQADLAPSAALILTNRRG